MKKMTWLLVATIAAVLTSSALAAVSADEAKKLGGPVLTEFGAERAGNAEGTIPAYTGERVKFKFVSPGDVSNLADPWGEKPLFTITAQNVQQYAKYLSDGQKETFKVYPTYRMDIYPTHRTHVMPKYLLDNTLKNATACKSVKDGLSMEGCYAGVPFPIPKTANEVMWNHELYFDAVNYGGRFRSIVVPKGQTKAFIQTEQDCWEHKVLFEPKRTTPLSPSEIYFETRCNFFGPARKAGEKLLLLETIDPSNPGLRAYQYIPGQRRVKLSPDLAYDTPSPVSGGYSTMDEIRVFAGALDRYNFKLVGKTEKYIPYNNFTSTDYKTCPLDVLTATPGFPNPLCIRWELHRVWVVEATLKPGFRHIYPKRTFYWDEDTAGAGVGESYDASGHMFRIGMNMSHPIPGEAGTFSGCTFVLDLLSGGWANSCVTNAPGSGWKIQPPVERTFFSPEDMAGSGIR